MFLIPFTLGFIVGLVLGSYIVTKLQSEDSK